MAVCTICRQEMLTKVSCDPGAMVLWGQPYEPIRYGRERGMGRWRPKGPCDDCGTLPGGVHHHGCDMEECPACHGQAISCGCGDDEEEQEGSWNDEWEGEEQGAWPPPWESLLAPPWPTPGPEPSRGVGGRRHPSSGAPAS